MKTKNLSLSILSILSLVILINFVSAAVISDWLLTTDGSASNVNANLNAGTFTSGGVLFNNFGVNGANAENWSLTSSVDDTKYFEVTISPKSDYSLTISDIGFDYSASIIGPASFELQYSKQTGFASPISIVIETDVSSTEESSANSVNIQVNEGETLTLRWFGYDFNSDTNEFRIKNLAIDGTVTQIITIDEPEEVTACTLIGNSNNNLRIKKIDITNKGMDTKGNSLVKFGDDDAWFPLDDIEVEIRIENKGEEKIEDIEVEWGLWDTSSDEWVIELDDEKDFDLKSDKEETLTISFNLEGSLDVDLDELSDGDHYRFYVIVNGYDNEVEDDICASDYEEIGIVIEDDFVVLSDFQFPETVSCDSEVQIIADAWNIGDSDQDDVYVRVFNTELGINQKVDVGDINAFDHEDFNVILNIPEDAKEKIYSINFEVYDEDDDIYENDFDDDKAEFHILLQVSGNCGIKTDALVSASLESGGRAGEELVVKATIVNTGSDSSTYNLNAVGYSEWATSVDVNPSTILSNKGDSREVLFTFNVKKDVSGEKTFDIEVRSGGELILTQPVSVMIEKAGGISGITGRVIGGSNLYLWGIGALNIILVIIIIIVAIRVARK